MPSSHAENSEPPARPLQNGQFLRRGSASQRFVAVRVAAEAADGLGREPDMAEDGNVGLDQGFDQPQPPGRGALDLNGRRPPLLDEPAGVGHGLLGGEMIREERHVAHDQGSPGGPGDRLRVIDHLVHRHRKRVFVAEEDHAEGISDEKEVRAGRVQDGSDGVIVGREGHDLAGALAGPEEGDRHSGGLLLGGHVLSFLPTPS